MNTSTQISLWMGNHIPAHFRQAVGLSDINQSVDENGAPCLQGRVIVFVAKVPSEVLESSVYRRANWQSEHSGWMPEGECGLFGVNALNTYPCPDGDGILIVGSSV